MDSTITSPLPNRSRPSENNRGRRGSVLLEVVLALALFVGAATVISAGINASVQAVYRLRLQTHAANLAISLISEMQMRARPIAPAGPEPCDPPFTNWTFRIELSQPEGMASDSEALRPVEVIVSHNEEPIVYRLTQVFRADEISTGGTNTIDSPPAGFGGFP